MESHEDVAVGIREFSLDIPGVHVVRHGIIDIQKGHGVLRHAGADVLAQSSVDIHLTGNGDAPAGETAVHIAGHEAELRLEGGPAFPCDGYIFPVALVRLHPV